MRVEAQSVCAGHGVGRCGVQSPCRDGHTVALGAGTGAG